MQESSLQVLSDRYARDAGVPATLVWAIIQTESAGVCGAWRVEPPYRYLWDNAAGKPYRMLTHAEIASEVAPHDFTATGGQSRDTEWWGQQASWGPMQTMGAVAREHGFTLAFPELCEPSNGVPIGCAHLADLIRHYGPKYGLAGAVAAYNAGSPRRTAGGRWVNQHYVDTVAANGAAELFKGAA